MIKITKDELRFLIYFIPLFFLKLINITADNKILMVVATGCFALFAIQIVRNGKFIKEEFIILIVMAAFSALLVFTCGKEGAFFSVIMIIAMKNVDLDDKVLTVLKIVGVLALLFSMYIERNGISMLRYINGTWTYILKRTNILYISFVAVVSLFIVMDKYISIKKAFVCLLLGYIMFRYTGSRTGFICLIMLVVLTQIFKFRIFSHNKIVKWICIILPEICFLFSFFTSKMYGKIPFLTNLNYSFQGRLALGNVFLNSYTPKLLGQKIFESSSAMNFQILDAAYLDMYLCYGVLFLTSWLIGTSLVIKYLYESEQYVKLSILLMYSIYGISETFLPNCFLNTSLFFYAEYLYYYENARRDR